VIYRKGEPKRINVGVLKKKSTQKTNTLQEMEAKKKSETGGCPVSRADRHRNLWMSAKPTPPVNLIFRKGKIRTLWEGNRATKEEAARLSKMGGIAICFVTTKG